MMLRNVSTRVVLPHRFISMVRRRHDLFEFQLLRQSTTILRFRPVLSNSNYGSCFSTSASPKRSTEPQQSSCDIFHTNKIEHDRKVAALQAKILSQIQQNNTDQMPNETQRLQNVDVEEQDLILQIIRHWLLKDVSFFTSTMNELDISLLESNKDGDYNDNINMLSSSASRQQQGEQHQHHGGRHRRRKRQIHDDIIGNTIKEEEMTKEFLNGHHPIQKVWDQYRSLYYDSIPEFEEYMTHNDCEFLKRHKILQDLQSVGFGRSEWNKRYRQVRGYHLHQDSITRHCAKLQVEVQRRTKAVTQANKELYDMEQLAKLLEKQSTSRDNLSLSGTGKRRRRPLRKQRMASTSIEEAKNDESKMTAEEPSFFQQAWSALSSLLSVAPSSSSITTSADTITRIEETMPDTKSVNGDNQKRPTLEEAPKLSKLRQRIVRKGTDVQMLQEKTNEAKRKLDLAQEKIRSFQSPLPPHEYEEAQLTVAKVRETISTHFARHIQGRHAHLIEQYQTLDSKTDLTRPQDWYPYARLDKRKIIFHGGPTNSGKTFSALQRLKEAEKGLYLGPLRLLAAEIYETLTAEGIYTNLFTGQERREIPFSTHTAATVEMCNVNEEYDVVVVDEIQMIAEPSRGAAWTKALLGLRCKEIHVCGGLEAKAIVEKLARACGDEFELNTYERFSELKIARKSLARDPNKRGAYSNVEPGDCVVAFSRNDIFAIKREIERTTNYKCCVIYGKLPPQTRADQARRFNDPDSGYDILVASDAIGMGLNLNIKRIVFNTIFKFNGDRIVRLGHSDIKQISGRAGRRNSPYPVGEVTCRDPRDLRYIRECLSTEIEPIEKAALLPTAAHIELFSEAIRAYDANDGNDDSDDLHQVLRQFNAMATVKGDFFLGRQTEMSMIAKTLRDVPINIKDAYSMCLSPTTEGSLNLLESYAWKIARGEVPGLPHRSVPKKAKSFDDLSYLCGIYADADLFLWLGYKFPPTNAVEQAAAIGRKEKTLEFINEALASTESLRLDHCYLKTATRLRTSWEAEHGVDGGDMKRSKDQSQDKSDDDNTDDDVYEEDDDYLLEEKRIVAY